MLSDVEDLAKYARRVDKRATKRPRFKVVQINLRAPNPLVEELTRRAWYLGMNRNAFIIWALQTFLKGRYGKAYIEYAEAREKAEGEE